MAALFFLPHPVIYLEHFDKLSVNYVERLTILPTKNHPCGAASEKFAEVRRSLNYLLENM